MIAREPKTVGESPGPWAKRAACAGVTDSVFFPERGEDGRQNVATAKQICASCPVRQDCLDFALVTCQIHGVWGGTTPRERRGIRRASRRLVSFDG